MKRFCTLFFLFLIVFNTIGYYGLLIMVQQMLTTKDLQKIEANANELGGNLILTIPIELPYASDSEEYTPLEGEIVYGGEVYRLVKQKFYRDMLFVVCIKDNQSSATRAKMSDYSRLFSGQQAEHADSNIKIINSLSKDYISVGYTVKPDHKGWCRTSNPEPITNLYCFGVSASIFHPPQYT